MMVRCPSPDQESPAIRDENEDAHRVKGSIRRDPELVRTLGAWYRDIHGALKNILGTKPSISYRKRVYNTRQTKRNIFTMVQSQLD